MDEKLTTERAMIKAIIDNFMRVLDRKAKYTVRFTKYEAWSIKFREFDGTYGQMLLLQARLAVRLSEEKIHNAVVHWDIPE